MYARLMYAPGRPVPLQHVMLHHIVFINAGYSGGPAKTTSCHGRRGEPFWGTGEEHEHLELPPGYGYQVDRRDHWRMQTMLMSHGLRARHAYVQYTVRLVTGRRLQRVKPLWLRAEGCLKFPSYEVDGGGAPGSTNVRRHRWTMPFSGRIVASGAHLHGSSKGVEISEPGCGDRTIIRHDPRYGLPGDTVYKIRPILHEPGPIATGYFLSKQGIPVRRGQKLDVTGLYDDEHPHPGVMAIAHVYIAPDASVKDPCAPMPSDAHIMWTRADGRAGAPYEPIPFNAVGADGKVHEIERPDGPIGRRGRQRVGEGRRLVLRRRERVDPGRRDGHVGLDRPPAPQRLPRRRPARRELDVAGPRIRLSQAVHRARHVPACSASFTRSQCTRWSRCGASPLTSWAA